MAFSSKTKVIITSVIIKSNLPLLKFILDFYGNQTSH
mgnify:CR=1 FL=1